MGVHNHPVPLLAEGMHSGELALTRTVGDPHLIGSEKAGKDAMHEILYGRVLDVIQPAVAKVADRVAVPPFQQCGARLLRQYPAPLKGIYIYLCSISLQVTKPLKTLRHSAKTAPS